MSSPVTNQILDRWNFDDQISFTIEKAKIDDAAKIIEVLQNAYFHPDIAELTHRIPETKSQFAINDVPRRLNHPETYTLLVCKVLSGSEETIVGTVYYQRANTDYSDEENQDLGEMGSLAVDPNYWKKYRIANHLLDAVEKLAMQDDKIRGIYLYAIGSRLPDSTYDSQLPKFYEKNGYRFAENRLASPQKWFSTLNGRINKVVMINDLSAKKNATQLASIIRKDEKREINVV